MTSANNWYVLGPHVICSLSRLRCYSSPTFSTFPFSLAPLSQLEPDSHSLSFPPLTCSQFLPSTLASALLSLFPAVSRPFPRLCRGDPSFISPFLRSPSYSPGALVLDACSSLDCAHRKNLRRTPWKHLISETLKQNLKVQPLLPLFPRIRKPNSKLFFSNFHFINWFYKYFILDWIQFLCFFI